MPLLSKYVFFFQFVPIIFTIMSTLTKIKVFFFFRSSSSFRSRSNQMAVKCFLTFFLFWIRPSFTCFDTLFRIFFFVTSMLGCGWHTRKEKEKLWPFVTLLQKIHLKYIRSLVDRFKILLDILIVDNNSDGFG